MPDPTPTPTPPHDARPGAEDLILRDHLAIDRTALANERTLLAYLRTAMGLAFIGLSILHFEGEHLPERLFAWTLVAAGAGLAALGFARFRRISRRLPRR